MRLNFFFVCSFILFIYSCTTEEPGVENTSDKKIQSMDIVHPLDALNQEELTTVIEVLKADDKYDDKTRIPEISLVEPSKSIVYAWKKGDAINRKAKLVILESNKTFECEIDISKKKLLTYEEVKDVQPALMLEEWMKAGELWKEDKRVVDELTRRGYNIDEVAGFPLTTGYFGADENRDKRLMKIWLCDIKDVKYNLFVKPINGITPIADMNQGKIIDVQIQKDVGRNDKTYDYDERTTGAKSMKPVKMIAPEGNNYTFKDGMIEWDEWKFHLKLDKRFGAIISLASFSGQSVAYQISSNEMFVPYMNAEEDWKYRSYMDIGEYGFGLLSSPLEVGTDVPENASLLNAVIPADNGMPGLSSGVIGVFERNTGRPLWRHAEFVNETHESRAEIELVVRTIPVVGNYDYVVDYVFSAKGTLTIEVGATGMDAAKAAKAKNMSDPTAIYETKVGNLIAPNLIGVYHDHFLSFRMDLDIDGQNNSIVSDEILPVNYPNNSRKSGWEVVEHPELKEGAVSNSIGGHDGSWRVVNKNSKNGLGQYKGYRILGHTELSQLAPNDYPQKRAAWSKEQLWVTPHNANELYPSGKYPNQSDGSDGILKWVAQNRSIDNTDIVCWYTMGFHHITVPEDWPVLSTMWHSVTLKPAMSFDRNPAIDIGK